jgi:hypothetical protein
MRLLVLLSLAACSSNPDVVDGGSDASTADTSTNDVAQQTDAGSDAGPQTATFSYTPEWTTVTAVSVYGGFGQSNDWTMPLLTLTKGTSGTFTGTTTLPLGQYPYVFKVVGDDAAGNKKTTFERYAIDPANPAYIACPAASPTYSTIDKNPCSQLTVPQPSAPALVHITGVVESGGNAIANYLVEIERNETGSHHFFANRVTTGSDGKYDLMAAPGQYRLQVLHPTYYSETDVQRDPPTTLAAVRRLISSDFKFVTAPVTAPGGEVSFGGYATFAPIATGTLPTAFAFTGVGTTPTHLDVYGTGMDGGGTEIGDPWYNGPPTTTGTSVFDGGFNTMKGNTPSVALGERYFWGVEEDITTDAGINWTAQTMVFDITWH